MMSICIYAIEGHGKRYSREATTESELAIEGRVGIVAALLALPRDAQRVSVVSDARAPRCRVVQSVARVRQGHVKACSQRACGILHEMW